MRQQLKQKTSTAHARVDRAVSVLALAERTSYVTFLRAHQLAYRSLLAALPPRHWVSAMLRDVVATLNDDLQVLDASGFGRPMVGLCTPLHPLGVAYVICGSHFGKRVLRLRWSRTTDPVVAAAGTYLASDTLKIGWIKTMDCLEHLADPAKQFHVLAADADRTFALFFDCLVAVKHWEKADAA